MKKKWVFNGKLTRYYVKKLFLMMRLMLFLMWVSVFVANANTASSQSVKFTAKFEGSSLAEVFEMLEKQSNIGFLVPGDLLKDQTKISLSFKEAEVEDVLHRILDPRGYEFEFVGKNVVITRKPGQAAVVQPRGVKGQVANSAGEPIPGVTVAVKGTNQGTISDTDGHFTLTNVTAETTLIFSFVGMRGQEIPVGGQTSIDVVMEEEAVGIEEVVAVGFGTQKKVNLTGAVGTVSSESLQNRPVQNVQIALQGLVPGLNIQQTSGFLNAAPTMNIRGTGNLGTGSSAAPLVLIDGVEGNIRTINPQDIESISVLKDAAASSIYGSRAPFGVILITTKKGDAKQIQVNYNNNFRWGAPTILPQVMDSYTQATFINDLCMNDNVTPHFTQERLQRIKDYQEGKITTVNVPDPANPTRWSSGYAGGNADNDIYDIYYKDWAFTQDHNISASGGNDRFTFYMGLGYQAMNGLLEIADDTYRRFTPTGTIEAQMTDWMKLRYTTRFTRFDYSRPTGLTDNLYNNLGRQGWSCLPFRDDNGIVNNTGQAMVLMYGGRYNDQTDFYNNLGSLVLEPVKNWVTTIEFNYNIKTWDTHEVSLPTYMYDVQGNPFIYRQESYVSNGHNKENFMNMNVYSTYQFSLDNNHNFRVLAGTQMEQMKRTAFGLRRAGVIVSDLPVVDLTSGLNYNGTAATPSVNGNINEWSTAGYFGRLNYDYQEKYLLEVNLRYDGTSRFRRETRWNWFPSFSAGWNIARESFWENLRNTVGVLKLRASYGKLGNQNTDSWYPTYQVISVSSNSGSWLQNGAQPNIASSPGLISSALTWEKINSSNVGVDVGALNNRLTGSFDYYVRRTLDMVGPAMELPNILGKSVPRSNNTDLKTYGFELEIGWQDRLDNGLSYNVRFMLSDYQTEITRYPNATRSLNTYIAGQKLGNIWGYGSIGIAKSNEEMEAHLASLPEGGQNALGSNWMAGDIMYRDLNNDGKINSGANTLNDHGDLKIIGNNTPRYQFGVDMNTEWKGFDLRIFFQGVAKRDWWTASPMLFGNSTGFWNQIGLKQHVDYFRLEPSNDLSANVDAYYPRPLYNNYAKNQRTQTRYLQNAAYIRLKNISVGYTVPQHLTRKLFVNRLRVFFSGENLWTGTKMASMFDPESIDGMNTYGDGYPLEKIISFGLNITL